MLSSYTLLLAVHKNSATEPRNNKVRLRAKITLLCPIFVVKVAIDKQAYVTAFEP